MTDKTHGRTATDHASDAEFGLGRHLPGADRLTAAGNVPPPAQSVVAAAQAAIRAAVEREEIPGAAVPVRRAFRRRWIAAAATVAAVAIGAAVLPAVSVGGKPPAATADAAAFLHAVADKSAAAPGDGEGGKNMVWKVVTRGFVPGAMSQPQTGSSTMSQGHTGRVANPWTPPFGPFGRVDLDDLPTDPAELRDRLTRGITDAQAFVNVSMVLGGSPLSPQQRTAIYRVLADFDGVRVDGTRKDALGRSGTEISSTVDSMTTRLLIDPASGVLLQVDLVTGKDIAATRCGSPLHCWPAFKAGGLVSRITFVSSSWVPWE